MTIPNDLSKDTKAIIAANLTVALSVLVTSGQNEKDATVKITGWLHSLFDQLFPDKDEDYPFRKIFP